MNRIKGAWLVLTGKADALRNLPELTGTPYDSLPNERDYLDPVCGVRGGWLVLTHRAEAYPRMTDGYLRAHQQRIYQALEIDAWVADLTDRLDP